MKFLSSIFRRRSKQHGKQTPVIAHYDTMLAEEISEAWGAVIVAVYCADEDHFNRLPQSVQCKGVVCGKCSFQQDILRAYYRSSMAVVQLTVPHEEELSEAHLMNMTREELIAEGYLVVAKHGHTTTFLPTLKWQRGMKMISSTTIHDHQGVRALPQHIKE